MVGRHCRRQAETAERWRRASMSATHLIACHASLWRCSALLLAMTLRKAGAQQLNDLLRQDIPLHAVPTITTRTTATTTTLTSTSTTRSKPSPGASVTAFPPAELAVTVPSGASEQGVSDASVAAGNAAASLPDRGGQSPRSVLLSSPYSASSALDRHANEGATLLEELFSMQPLTMAKQLGGGIMAIVVLVIVWQLRSFFLVLFTGDDRIHASVLDFVWWACFRCCGVCSHNWSRFLTNWTCCPERLQGRNLVKFCGAQLGITTHAVELSNITVGDLPCRDSFGDFLVSFECAANPPITTSVAQGCVPKVVHIPEVINLRIRDSHLETKVRIVVKQLTLVGHRELCDIHFSASNIVHWSQDPEHNFKRFGLRPMDRHMELATPPWIFLEFDQHKNDARHLSMFADDAATVRTATRDGSFSEWRMPSFKHKYQLLDGSGLAILEPHEEGVAAVRQYRTCVDWVVSCIHILTFLVAVSYILVRLYLHDCYTQFYYLTMAALAQPPVAFPISTANLVRLVGACEDSLVGTGIKDGQGHPCRPGFQEVAAICGRALPGGQPHPAVQPWGSLFLQRSLGVELPEIPCFQGVCEVNHEVHQWDWTIVTVVAMLLVCNACLLKPFAEKFKRRVSMGPPMADGSFSSRMVCPMGAE
mmetsp:Transcript_117868/g.263488  ORF Transcript_117868/g.263488 Transcript_117868/m.263488 type:complete len:649 (+) Transcript_117868:70-2016(+)